MLAFNTHRCSASGRARNARGSHFVGIQAIQHVKARASTIQALSSKLDAHNCHENMDGRRGCQALCHKAPETRSCIYLFAVGRYSPPLCRKSRSAQGLLSLLVHTGIPDWRFYFFEILPDAPAWLLPWHALLGSPFLGAPILGLFSGMFYYFISFCAPIAFPESATSIHFSQRSLNSLVTPHEPRRIYPILRNRDMHTIRRSHGLVGSGMFLDLQHCPK